MREEGGGGGGGGGMMMGGMALDERAYETVCRACVPGGKWQRSAEVGSLGGG